MHHRNIRLIVACLFALMSSHRAAADTITLRNAVRLDGDAREVTLGDIAVLEGDDAQRLAAMRIAGVSANDDVVEIDIREVRQRLDDAGVNWARLNLSGRRVIVRSARGDAASTPLAMTPASLGGGDEPAAADHRARDDHVASDLVHQGTIRGRIAALLITALRLEPTDLRVSFLQRDEEFLSRAASADSMEQYEIQPLGSASSDRIDFAVRTWREGRVIDRRNVAAIPLIRVHGAALTVDLSTGTMIRADALESQERWLPPSQASLACSVAEAVGCVAARNLKAGELLRTNAVRREAIVKRGDLVIVRCLVGGVAISLQAEARADGGEGDTIEFRKTGERETFLATIAGRGEAVRDLRQSSQTWN